MSFEFGRIIVDLGDNDGSGRWALGFKMGRGNCNQKRKKWFESSGEQE